MVVMMPFPSLITFEDQQNHEEVHNTKHLASIEFQMPKGSSGVCRRFPGSRRV